jgi:hypothetical protein
MVNHKSREPTEFAYKLLLLIAAKEGNLTSHPVAAMQLQTANGFSIPMQNV